MSVYAALEGQLLLKETIDFIQRDLEYLYKQLDELSGQHDLVNKRFEEIPFDDNSEHQILSNMMDETSFSLFELRCRIEQLAESIQSTLNLNPETERKDFFENILDSCDRLSAITHDLAAE